MTTSLKFARSQNTLRPPALRVRLKSSTRGRRANSASAVLTETLTAPAASRSRAEIRGSHDKACRPGQGSRNMGPVITSFAESVPVGAGRVNVGARLSRRGIRLALDRSSRWPGSCRRRHRGRAKTARCALSVEPRSASVLRTPRACACLAPTACGPPTSPSLALAEPNSSTSPTTSATRICARHASIWIDPSGAKTIARYASRSILPRLPAVEKKPATDVCATTLNAGSTVVAGARISPPVDTCANGG